jgi:NADH:ubiquinone oxidoreductase subunit 2 (subunit N)
MILLALTLSYEKNNYLTDYIKFNRIVFLILIQGAYLACNILNVKAIEGGVGVFGGVFKITVLSQVFDILLCIIGGFTVILVCFSPYFLRLYNNNILINIFTDSKNYQNSSVTSLKNYFKNSSKFINFNSYTDYKNWNNVYIMVIKFLKKLSKIFPNFKLKSPILLEERIWSTRLEVKEFSLLLLYTVIGASLLISANNLVSLYLSLELQSFTLYILAASQIRSFKGTSGGLKYFLLGGLSSGFILLGCSLLYAYTGTLNIEHIFYIYSDTSINYILDPCLLVLFSGILFKVSAVPFHNWAPDVYSDVPTYTTTWLIVIAKVSILIFMLLFVHNIYTALNINSLSQVDQYYSNIDHYFNNSNLSFTASNDIIDNNNIFVYNSDISILNNFFSFININIPLSFWNASYSSLGLWTNIIIISALFSLIIGTIVGISQSRIKRLFAYSTITHVGFLLLALSLNTITSIDAFLFYLIQYTITNLNLFFILIAWGYLYCLYYLEKDFIPIRFLNINPLLGKDIYIEPTLYDYGQFIKNKLNEKNNIYDYNYPYSNLKINSKNNDLNITHHNDHYDFDTENTEWLYTPVPFLTNFKGMHYKDSFLAFCLTITLLSLAGIPPMIGFFAKQQVLLAAMQSDYLFISIVIIFTSVIGAAYYLRIIKFIYFYDEVFMPYYINNSLNSNNYNSYTHNFNFINNNNNNNNKNSNYKFNNVFFDSDNNSNITMLPSNNLSFIIALLTNITFFYFLKPYVLINLISTITILIHHI